MARRVNVVLADDTEFECDWVKITESGALMAFDFDRVRGQDRDGNYPKLLRAAWNTDQWDSVEPKEDN